MEIIGSDVTATGAGAALTAAIKENCWKVMLTATHACWVSYDGSATPTAAAADTDGSVYIPANDNIYFTVQPGAKFSVIQDDAIGHLCVTYLGGKRD